MLALRSRCASSLVCEREVQACREDYVVLLGSCRRVRDVDVAELVLPTKPLANLRDGAHVEGPPVITSLLQIGVEIDVLHEDGTLSELLVQFLAKSESDEPVGLPVGLKDSSGCG